MSAFLQQFCWHKSLIVSYHKEALLTILKSPLENWYPSTLPPTFHGRAVFPHSCQHEGTMTFENIFANSQAGKLPAPHSSFFYYFSDFKLSWTFSHNLLATVCMCACICAYDIVCVNHSFIPCAHFCTEMFSFSYWSPKPLHTVRILALCHTVASWSSGFQFYDLLSWFCMT